MENLSIPVKQEEFSEEEEEPGLNESEHSIDDPVEGESDNEESVFLAGSIKVEYPVDDYEYKYKTECASHSVYESDDNDANPYKPGKIEKNPCSMAFHTNANRLTFDNASDLPFSSRKRSIQEGDGGASSDEEAIRTPLPGTSRAYRTSEPVLPTLESANAQHIISVPEHDVDDYDMSSGHFMEPSSAILPASFTSQPSTFTLQPSSFKLQPSSFTLQPSSFAVQPTLFIAQPSYSVTDSVAVEERDEEEDTDERPAQCDRSKLEFLREVKSNFRNRTSFVKGPYQCEVCQRRFPFKSNLVAHQRQHSGEKPYQCDQCPKKFAGKYGLIGHLRKHTGEKPFKCDLCDRLFAHLSGLRYHERTHDEEKLFACHVCGQRYTQKANLESHMRKHPGAKPYQCEECNKWFRHKIDLKLHKRAHRKRPYGAVERNECEIIDLEFSEK